MESKLYEETIVFATKKDIAKLETKISDSKVDIIKWMIATSVVLCGILIASMKLFLHL